MKKYHTHKTKIKFSNTRSKKALPLQGNFRTTFTLNKESTFDFLELLLATYTKEVRGNLRITASTESGNYTWDIDLARVQDNKFIRLVFKKTAPFKSLELTLTPTYTGENFLAIWANDDSLCFRLGVYEIETLELDRTPKISILTPVYNPDVRYLEAAVESVMAQSYDNWELCIVDDASSDPKVLSYLQSLDDKRIKQHYRNSNGHISQSTNDALELATGDYMCMLDHDDMLHKDALLEVARVLNDKPKTQLVYTDEDKIDVDDIRSNPYHKPAWSPSLLESQMYTCHLSVYKTGLVKDLGGFRIGYEGSQDHDLALRYTELYTHIEHIPEVLYHWRTVQGSTANGVQAKPMARMNAVRAISDHLERTGSSGRVTPEIHTGIYRVDRDIVHSFVTIIIPSKDNIGLLKSCLHSIKQSTYKNFEVVIADNGSQNPDTLDFLINMPKEFIPINSSKNSVRVEYCPGEFNFSAIVNKAVHSTSSEYVIILNDDIEVITTDWIEQMIQQIQKDKVAAVGAKLLYADGRIQHAGVLIAVGGVAGHCHKNIPDSNPGYFARPHTVHEVSAVTGACMMVKRSVFDEVSGFEESLPRAFNDVDFCLKLRAVGYNIIYTPYATLFHHESVSRGKDAGDDPLFMKSVQYMFDKWDTQSYHDPYFNKNFSRLHEVYVIS